MPLLGLAAARADPSAAFDSGFHGDASVGVAPVQAARRSAREPVPARGYSRRAARCCARRCPSWRANDESSSREARRTPTQPITTRFFRPLARVIGRASSPRRTGSASTGMEGGKPRVIRRFPACRAMKDARDHPRTAPSSEAEASEPIITNSASHSTSRRRPVSPKRTGSRLDLRDLALPDRAESPGVDQPPQLVDIARPCHAGNSSPR